MKEIKYFLLFSLTGIFAFITINVHAQFCYNLGFENGDFTNWDAYSWHYSIQYKWSDTVPVSGIVPGRHTIIRDIATYDTNTGNALKLIPPGYRYSARLGRSKTKTQFESQWNENQSLRYTMKINSENALLILKFALVLQYDYEHTQKQEPRFSLSLFKENGDTIHGCANYDVFASNTREKGFQLFKPEGMEEIIQWRDWTTVGVDLSPYINSTIIIEFKTNDCTLGRDFGYAYFVASCRPLNIVLKYCTGDSIARLTAPEGFEKYSWMNAYGTVIDTNQILVVENPLEGAVYYCKLTSVTDCEVTLSSTVNKYTPKADFSSVMIDCNSNIVQLTNLSTKNRPESSLLYLWDFGEGETSSEKNPINKFITSGRHWVTLVVRNPPSACVDTLTKEIESFSPPLVDIAGYSTYCPGLSTYLVAYGAWEYTWNNGSNNDSIEVSAPGGDFWMIGRSSTGCADTSYRTVTEEPDWEFRVEGDSILCEGDSSIFTSFGAAQYLWSTGDTIDSILVSRAGNYTSTGENPRGCIKSKSFNVIEIPPPLVEFTLSNHSLDSRHNQLSGNLPAETDVFYTWDMGDGRTETGSSIQHAYTITYDTLAYTISLLATHKFGCLNSSSEIIDIVPFVPNVFSPNNDDINDIFMPELELQVFDRYGVILYKGTEGWDGLFNGQPAEPDTYFYSLYYYDRNQAKHNIKGYVTLVR